MKSPGLPARRSFLRRRLLDPVVGQLTQGITPEKVALTFAVGSAVAVFPILGTTTLLCFLIGVALKLNQPIIQLINQVFWPVQLPSIYLCVRLGEWLFNAPQVSFNISRMRRLFWDHPRIFLDEFGTSGVHAIAVWMVLAPIYMAITYYPALLIAREIARLKMEAATKESFQP